MNTPTPPTSGPYNAMLEIEKLLYPHKEEIRSLMREWVKTRTPNQLIALMRETMSAPPHPVPTATPGGMTGETSHTHAERLCQSIDKHLTKKKFAKVNHHDKLYQAICAWMAVEYRAQVTHPPTPEA